MNKAAERKLRDQLNELTKRVQELESRPIFVPQPFYVPAPVYPSPVYPMTPPFYVGTPHPNTSFILCGNAPGCSPITT
jgi:hypothetical protein